VDPTATAVTPVGAGIPLGAVALSSQAVAVARSPISARAWKLRKSSLISRFPLVNEMPPVSCNSRIRAVHGDLVARS
jgi:hypothetical protein